jgi:hypothetical protein
MVSLVVPVWAPFSTADFMQMGATLMLRGGVSDQVLIKGYDKSVPRQ